LAGSQRLVGLDIDEEHPVRAGGHGEDVKALDAKDFYSTRALSRTGSWPG